MKKLLILALILVGGVATADSTITSKQYVDAALDTLQSQIPAKNTDTVLTNTGTAGEIGEKKIYNTNNSYDEQTDALVTAGAFNSAVQNALSSEFVCIERNSQGCLLYEVRGATQNRILPIGYTQLEYIQTTGTQWIDTKLPTQNNLDFEIKLRYSGGNLFGDTQGVFGYLLSGGGGTSNLYVVKSTTNGKLILSYGANPQELYTSVVAGKDYVYTLIGNVFSINNSETFNITRTAILEQNNMYVGRRNGLNTASLVGRIYYVKIWGSGVLVRNFIPVRRDSDGELGMYDTVSKTFFTNIGTGEFIAGPAGNSNLYLPSGN